MAKAFGIFADAVDLAGPFTSCVECFEHIQFGRNFGKDYEMSLVKLDVVQLRLSRWGVSVGLVADPIEPRPSTPASQTRASDAELDLVKSFLGKIIEVFEEVQTLSIMFKTKAEKSKSTDLALYDPNTDLGPQFRSLHLKTRSAALRRQRGGYFLEEEAWALYEKRKFDWLIEGVTRSVDALDQQFPGARERQGALCKQELSEIKDTDGLKLLGDIAGKDDTLLTESVTNALAAQGTVYRNFEISGDKTAKTHVGKEYAAGESYIERGDTFEGFKISGKGSTHVGNRYGNSGASNVCMPLPRESD